MRSDDPFYPLREAYSLERWQQLEEARERRGWARETRPGVAAGDKKEGVA